MDISPLISRIEAFKDEAHSMLAVHETSKSRVVLLEKSYSDLKGLSLSQDDMFRQALRCIENDLHRASHVMAWCGFMDYLIEKLGSDGFKKLRAARQKWSFNAAEDLMEQTTDYALVEAARAAGLISKPEMKAFHGLLNKRNECAHPSSFLPSMNESLGYLTEVLQRIRKLQAKPY